MTKIAFDNKMLYKMFGIEWALPEKAIEYFQTENSFSPNTPQEEIDRKFEYDLRNYFQATESAWENYLSFTEAIEKVIVFEDRTIFVISDTRKLLKAILKCINGYGEFYFSDINQLVKTTDGTQIKTIKSHFYWLKYYSEIYVRRSINNIMEDYLNS